MNAEEIRKKAIECSKTSITQRCCNPCTECEYGEYFLSMDVSCTTLYGYEHGFADARLDIANECRYLLNSGMGKKKSLEHLIRILEKEGEQNG